MTAALQILDPGPATTVQDLGRPQARRVGVPVSGTLAPDWLRVANALVGAPQDAAGLEVRLVGPRFEVLAPLCVAAAGDVELRVDREDGEPFTVSPFTAAALLPGDRVTTGPVRAGAFALLAFAGGIDVPRMLGSRATYARARLGGLAGRALQAGDRIVLGAADPPRPMALPRPPADDPASPIRILPGPQVDHFTEDAFSTFLNAEFEVTTEVDRMGMRLAGPPLAHLRPDMAQIVSDGIVPGAIQVPGNGAPIVLLADGQTVGGYPKIATVISADLPRLARMAPGQRLRFREIGVREAETARRAEAQRIAALLETARPAAPVGGLDLRSLYESNLVSGVVEGSEP